MSSTDDTEALLAQRGSIYGDPVPQYGRIAQVWSGMIGYEISAHTAALMMAALKLVRAVDAPGHTDSLDDAHGYVSIGQRIERSWHELEPKEPAEQPKLLLPERVAHPDGSHCELTNGVYRVFIKARGDIVPDIGDICPYHGRIEAPEVGPISGKNFPAEPDTGVCRRFGGHVSTTRHTSKDCPWVDR